MRNEFGALTSSSLFLWNKTYGLIEPTPHQRERHESSSVTNRVIGWHTQGDYAFEPPCETHALVVPDDVQQLATLFHHRWLHMRRPLWGRVAP
jgi:hypothetical protein